MALFLVVYVVFYLLPGIYTGSILQYRKIGKAYLISRQAEPFYFWFEIGYHATVASFIALLEYVCLVGAGWIQRIQFIDAAGKKSIAWIAGVFAKPMPLWVGGVVLGWIFYLIFIIVR